MPSSRLRTVFLRAALVCAVLAVAWIGLGFTPFLPRKNPITNVRYTAGRVAGAFVSLDSHFIAYPGTLSTRSAGVVHELDYFNVFGTSAFCQYSYFPWAASDDGPITGVYCELEEPFETAQFKVRVLDKPGASIAWVAGYNRSIVGRLWKNRRSLSNESAE
jgi:hypothetical protein